MAADPASSAALADLSRRMRQGDDAAWCSFHEQYGPLMFRILISDTRGDPHLAGEALQRAYLRVARHVRICESETMWIAWLRMVCRSALSDARRREKRFWDFFGSADVDGSSVPPTPANDSDMFATLDRALANLDPGMRQLLEWKYYVGESVSAIASRLQLTPKAVESRLTRARVELRRLMASTGPTSQEVR